MNKKRKNKKLLKMTHKVNSMADYVLYDKFFCYKINDKEVLVLTYHKVEEGMLKEFIDKEK